MFLQSVITSLLLGTSPLLRIHKHIVVYLTTYPLCTMRWELSYTTTFILVDANTTSRSLKCNFVCGSLHERLPRLRTSTSPDSLHITFYSDSHLGAYHVTRRSLVFLYCSHWRFYYLLKKWRMINFVCLISKQSINRFMSYVLQELEWNILIVETKIRTVDFRLNWKLGKF